jgi:phenylalanyl-tRNA synthetase beta chain
VRIVHQWLAELVDIPADVEAVAREIALRGFEVAAVENGVIDFEITANRPDCLSHRGMAIESAVIWGGTPNARLSGRIASDSAISVTIDAADLCPRYSAQLFEVKVGPSPDWLARRLEAAGVRPINNIVDVTNYVMLEIGQPMHAFDLDTLAGGELVIRRARAGERLRTLDGIDRALEPGMLVIADAQRAVALGGVMGGQDTEITAATRRMVLESAYFDPASVRRTSKSLGLKTEASIRFERGADIEASLLGLGRAAELLEQIGAAQPGATRDVYPSPRVPVELELRTSRIRHLLGIEVPAAEVQRILRTLRFDVKPVDDSRWAVTVPSFRVDVTREVDLIEEVGRHHGFHRLPATFPPLAAAQAAPDPRIERDRRIRAVLTASGLSEAMTFAFVEREAALPFCPEGTQPVPITNPLSEKYAVLRPSLLPGLVDSCSHNRRRGQKNVRLFETGSRFNAEGEGRATGIICAGESGDADWSRDPHPVDFFDIKGVVETLCEALGAEGLDCVSSTTPYLVRGRSAELRAGGRRIGVAGQLEPSIAEARGLPRGEEVYVAEVDLDAIAGSVDHQELRAESLPKFPAIVRDLSILIPDVLPAATVRGTIRSAAPATLESLVEFDRYQGKGVPAGLVSLSLRLTFRARERTLTDEEIEAAMNTIVEALQEAHGAQRR